MSGQLLGLLIGPFEAFGFMRVALVASFALALANGPVGTLLLMRRESLSGYVLSHAVMPGAALGFLYAGYSLAALSFGGLLTGLVVAGLAARKTRSMPQRQDVILIAFYLVSLSFGILIVAARGSQADLMHVLFGTVLAVDVNALLLIAGITSMTLLVIAALYRPLAVESFDPSFLRDCLQLKRHGRTSFLRSDAYDDSIGSLRHDAIRPLGTVATENCQRASNQRIVPLLVTG